MRPRQAPRALSPNIVNLLLDNWAPEWDLVDDGDMFGIFELTDADLARVWREHRAELMAEAERRGVVVPWGSKFDGETTP